MYWKLQISEIVLKHRKDCSTEKIVAYVAILYRFAFRLRWRLRLSWRLSLRKKLVSKEALLMNGPLYVQHWTFQNNSSNHIFIYTILNV